MRAEGGIAAVVPQLVDSLARFEIDSQLFAFEGGEPIKFTRVPRSGMPWLLENELLKRINEQTVSDEQVIIHSHGLWAPLNIAAAMCARKLGIPLVVSTHGMLLPWARSHKKLRKLIAWQIYQKEILDSAACIHVSSTTETDQISNQGICSNIAMIPFGIAMPPSGIEKPKTDRRRLVFLGRLHPIKNLENLILAWKQANPSGWELVIAGPSEPAYLSHLKKLVHKESLTGGVLFPGPVYDDKKWGLLHSADLVVLPSFSENFGVVVVEALLCAKPVITSTGVPWGHLQALGCGWSALGSVAGLSNAILQGTSLRAEQRKAMGRIAMDYAKSEYSLKVCGNRFSRMYESAFNSLV